METYINTNTQTGVKTTNQQQAAGKPFSTKRALIRKKFVNRRILALVFLVSFVYIFAHILVIRHVPLYVIIPLELIIFFLVWNKFYQVLYDLKLLFYFDSTYDSGERFPVNTAYPAISFIIPACHEPFAVAKMTFDSIVNTPYKGRKDIIVVDNSRETDTDDFKSFKHYVDTYEEQHPGENITACFIHNTEQGKLKPGNLDLGFQLVKNTDYVVILDVDSTLPAQGNLLEIAVAEFMADGKLGFLQFAIKATNNHFNDLSQAVAASQDLHRLRLMSRSFGGYKIFEGHNGMWRTTVLDTIGPWTDYYKGNIMVTEDVMKATLVYAKGYYGKSLNTLTGEWVPCSINALDSMWMRWTYGTSQVLFKCFREIYWGYASIVEKFDITYHIMNHLANGLVFLVAVFLQWFTPGAAANLFLLAGFLLPQLVAFITMYSMSISKLKASPLKRLQYLYSAFFLVDTFLMLTQLKSILNFLAGIPQGWKVTAKGTEKSAKWTDLVRTKLFHIGWPVAAITVCMVSWIVRDGATLASLGNYALLLFMSLSVLLCMVVFRKEKNEIPYDIESAAIDGHQAKEINMPEYKFDVA